MHLQYFPSSISRPFWDGFRKMYCRQIFLLRLQLYLLNLSHLMKYWYLLVYHHLTFLFTWWANYLNLLLYLWTALLLSGTPSIHSDKIVEWWSAKMYYFCFSLYLLIKKYYNKFNTSVFNFISSLIDYDLIMIIYLFYN